MNTMRQKGISIYPSKQEISTMKGYIEKAHACGFKRIFASLLEVNLETKASTIEKFREVFEFARSFGFDICLDIAPRIFNALALSYDDLQFFHEIFVTTIRLDVPLDGKTEAAMTYNPYGINIEVNLSNGFDYLQNILAYAPIKDRLLASHNFYPQHYTGLDWNYFVQVTKLCKSANIRTSAFISSRFAKDGPWTINDGLVTCEIHRNRSLTNQASHLFGTNLIDDVIIGNAYASDEELTCLGKLDPYKIALEINFAKNCSDLEKTIVGLDNHFRRGDINTSLIRSTQSRVNYKNSQFPPRLSQGTFWPKGTIVIGNDEFGIYKGELQLLLVDMPVDQRKNQVAFLTEESKILLELIAPWGKFKFQEGKDDAKQN